MTKLPISVIIVDDEKPARDELKFIIDKDSHYKVVGEADCGWDAIKLVEELKPDVVFLDIEMHDINGLEVARKIYKAEYSPAIVFATAYNQHAISAFEVRAIDYILKPFDDERIMETLVRIKSTILKSEAASELVEKITSMLMDPSQKTTIQTKEEQSVVKVPVENNGRLLLLDPKDIIFAATGNDKEINIYTRLEIYHAKMNLNTLEKTKLKFFRVHRSFLVNLDEVKELVSWFKGNYLLVMSDKNKTEIPVSRNLSKELKERLGLN